MKKLLVVIAAFATLAAAAQTRGLKIAYFDMEYILEKVPDYAEAKNQLELKAGKWKQEIEAKKNDVTKLKASLQAEKALLTKELIEEREDEIKYLEAELIDFQDKKFGPKGELISQKAVLVKPIQDQVFNAIQDIAEERKLDFVFDRSSDLTMVFAAQRHDLSDLIIRRLTRSAKREQLSSKEVKKLEKQEAEEDRMSDPDVADRQKALDEKKAARQKVIDDRKAAADAKRAAAEERRNQLRQENEAKRAEAISARKAANAQRAAGNTGNQSATDKPADNGKAPANTSPSAGDVNSDDDSPNTNKPAGTAPAKHTAEKPARTTQEERNKIIEERKKAAEDRRKKILADREAAKKAREEQNKAKQNGTNGEDSKPE